MATPELAAATKHDIAEFLSRKRRDSLASRIQFRYLFAMAVIFPNPAFHRSPRFTDNASPAVEALELEILEHTRRASRLRFVRARLSAGLFAKKSWTPLGFVRAGDYSRERLGLTGRTLEDDARVARALERLPQTTAAFLNSTLSWTQVRLVTSIARTDNEHQWIETALHRDTRSLGALVRERKHAAAQPPDTAPSPLSAEPQEKPQEESEEEPVRFSVRVSRDGRRLWRAACELAERSAGSALTQAQVLELVVAEAASGAPHSHNSDSGSSMDRSEDTATGHSESARASNPSNLDADRAGASDPPSLDDMFHQPCPGDPFLLDARLREIELAMQRIDADLGRLLVLALERRLHRHFGFASFADYVDARLDFCPRKAWALIAIERATSRACAEFAIAYREGRISHLAASRLLPMMGHRHGAAWIERAGLVTLRRLEAEVTWALDHRDAATGMQSFDAPPPPPLDHDLGDAASVLNRDQVQMRAHGDTPEPAGLRVDLHFLVPVEVAGLAEHTMLALRRGPEQRGCAFERMVASALLEWMSVPSHRDPVFARDGWRCAVPGCRSRRNLHDHHVLFRSHGGDNKRDNRVTVCAAHHLHGLHAGRIRARGHAPSGIVWTMPLARLLGDRYLARA